MNEIEKLKLEIELLKKQVADLSFKVETQDDFMYKSGKRLFINKEIQFLQKCYNKSGSLITQINPT